MPSFYLIKIAKLNDNKYLGENNMADDIKTLKITTVGENKYTYEKEPGFPFTIVEGEAYKRVPAQRYEIVFPKSVNSAETYVNLYTSNCSFDDFPFFGAIQFSDEDCLDGDDFYLSFLIYADCSATSHPTLFHEVAQGEYGRYVISETQVADEPVAFTLEPVYDYVLVE